jgi:ubiquinone/menaquinone biosynthesis C-methylase UbiE
VSQQRNILDVGDLFAYYDDDPEIYEILSRSEDADNNILHTIQNLVSFRGKRVLELGGGTGRFSIPISSQAEMLYAIDTSSSFLNVLKAKAKGRKIEVLKATFCEIPMKDESVDVAVSTWSFPSYAETKDSDFQEISRVIREGGDMVFVDNYPGGEYHEMMMRFLSNPGTHSIEVNEWLLSKGFTRKVVDVLVDLGSEETMERVLSGTPELERIKDYLAKQDKTGFDLKASVFHGRKG